MGNPALFPLIANCSSDDIVIVQINPLVRDQPTASEILNRLNEITMNASLRHELQFHCAHAGVDRFRTVVR
jgi:NTE family protein